MPNHPLEEGNDLQLDFHKIKDIAQKDLDVIPAIAQEVNTKEVLIVGYVNEAALQHALTTKKATFWSTSRNELWVKGETSGSTLELVEVRVNCEQNSILYLVKAHNGACHTKDQNNQYRSSCFYRKINDQNKLEQLSLI